jgi:S-adenosylmethionine:tRNA ribosyltransferase-isomerase
LIDSLKEKGIAFDEVLLHVGLDTFAPVNEENVEEHAIHREWCQVSAATAEHIRRTKQAGGRIIAVAPPPCVPSNPLHVLCRRQS